MAGPLGRLRTAPAQTRRSAAAKLRIDEQGQHGQDREDGDGGDDRALELVPQGVAEGKEQDEDGRPRLAAGGFEEDLGVDHGVQFGLPVAEPAGEDAFRHVRLTTVLAIKVPKSQVEGQRVRDFIDLPCRTLRWPVFSTLMQTTISLRTVYDVYMTKLVQLSEEAYSRLKQAKRVGESFSQAVNRILGTIPGRLPLADAMAEIGSWRTDADRAEHLRLLKEMDDLDLASQRRQAKARKR